MSSSESSEKLGVLFGWLMLVLPSDSRQLDSLPSNKQAIRSTLNFKGKDWLFLVSTCLLANEKAFGEADSYLQSES